MSEKKQVSLGEALYHLHEMLANPDSVLYQHPWVTQEWAEQYFGSEAEAKFVSLLTPEVVQFLLNIPKPGHPDYAEYNVRGNPDMQAAYEETFECKWIEGNPRSRMHFALGYAKALGKQVERIREKEEEYIKAQPDNCQKCLGERGGVLGNENRVDGLVICDYCHTEMTHGKWESPAPPFDFAGAIAHNQFVWKGKKCTVEGCVWCKREAKT